jgi:uncharacterized protein (DUF305 family)
VPARRLTAIATLLLVLAGCGTARSAPPPAPPEPSLSAEFNAADVAFVRALIPHHEQGIALAEIGAKATRPDVRMLTGAIVSTERDEAKRMAGWLAAWKQPPPPAPKATELPKAAGQALDRAVLTDLIAHQSEAIKLADKETRDGRNLNAISFAVQIQKSRQAEIQQMRTYLTS